MSQSHLIPNTMSQLISSRTNNGGLTHVSKQHSPRWHVSGCNTRLRESIPSHIDDRPRISTRVSQSHPRWICNRPGWIPNTTLGLWPLHLVLEIKCSRKKRTYMINYVTSYLFICGPLLSSTKRHNNRYSRHPQFIYDRNLTAGVTSTKLLQRESMSVNTFLRR